VVRYLEGRRTSELLLAGLSCSFIVASGIVQDFGLALRGAGVSEAWMPAAVGLCFVPPFLVGVWCLDRLPPPTPEDVALRVERRPMNRSDRSDFFCRFAPGLVLLFVVYFFLTAYRDFRLKYFVEILGHWSGKVDPGVFSWTEIPIGFAVIAALAALYFIKGARQGLVASFGLMAVGLALMAGGTLLLDGGWVGGNGLWWMTVVGLGSYLTYVPYSTVLFDRLIASTRAAGTAVFTIYLADTVGWSGAILTPLYKDLGQAGLSSFAFFRWFTYGLSLGGIVLLVTSCWFFLSQSPGEALDGTLPNKAGE
jgi:hypothetical protein